MMGPTKLSTIRAELRKSFKMSDGKLLAWFNDQMKAFGRRPRNNQAELDTLRLLRDALTREPKEKPTKRRRKRMSSRSKR
jgi:hypothetical protein